MLGKQKNKEIKISLYYTINGGIISIKSNKLIITPPNANAKLRIVHILEVQFSFPVNAVTPTPATIIAKSNAKKPPKNPEIKVIKPNTSVPTILKISLNFSFYSPVLSLYFHH